MRNIYKPLLLVLFAVVGSLGMNAQIKYYSVGNNLVTSIEPGTNYVLKNAL